jgi:hypothetical protein
VCLVSYISASSELHGATLKQDAKTTGTAFEQLVMEQEQDS